MRHRDEAVISGSGKAAPDLTDELRQPTLIVATAMTVLVVNTALETVLAMIGISVDIVVGGVELVSVVVCHFGSGTSLLHRQQSLRGR